MEVLKKHPAVCFMSGQQLQGPLVGNALNSLIKESSVILTQCLILKTFFKDIHRALVPGGRFILEWVSPSEPCDGTSDDPWSKCEEACLTHVEADIKYLYIPPGNTEILKEKIETAGFKLSVDSWSLGEETNHSQFDHKAYYDHTACHRPLRSIYKPNKAEEILEDMKKKLPGMSFKLQVSFLLESKASN